MCIFIDKQRPKHIVPVIVGWDEEFYATDHHHLTRALMDSSVPKDEQVMYAQITEDYSDLDELEFWTKMIEQGYTWLFDERGTQPVSPFHLAEDMSGLQNDFYRSLAYFVRTFGGFGKTNISYAEFVWANWFRQTIPLPWPKHIPSNSANSAQLSSLIPKILEAPSAVKWNVCEVMPYEPPCLINEAFVLKNIFNKAMLLAQSPLAGHLPGYGQGEVEDVHCDVSLIQERMNAHEKTRFLKSSFPRHRKVLHS
jgi:hypothetical protein